MASQLENGTAYMEMGKMIYFELEEKELRVLSVLAEQGAMSPSQVAAETWTLPGEALSMLKSLSQAGFVLLRGDTNSSDGLLVAPTSKARSYLNGGNQENAE